MVKKLGRKFELLRGTRQDSARRQQTLAAAIEWSEEPLSAWERSAFRQLSVFHGTFSEEAADAVADLSAHAGAPKGAAAARVLASRSLLVAAETDAGTRFSMYRTLREYALGRIPGAGPEGRGAAEDRHEAFYLELSRRIVSATALMETRDRAALDLENLFAAQDHALARGEAGAVAAARIVLGARYTVPWRGPLASGIARFRRSLEALEAASPPDPREKLLLVGALHIALSRATRIEGDWKAGMEHAFKATETARGTDAWEVLSEGLWESAYILFAKGDYAKGDPLLAECERVSRERGLAVRLVTALCLKAARLEASASVGEAMSAAREALARAREHGRRDVVAEALNVLGNQLCAAGEPRAAVEAYRESVDLMEPGSPDVTASVKLANLADVLGEMGEIEEADACYRRAMEMDLAVGRRAHVAYGRLRLGRLRLYEGKLEEAFSLIAAAREAFRALSTPQMLLSTAAVAALAHLEAGEPAKALAEVESLDAELASQEEVNWKIEAATLRARALCALGRRREAAERIRSERAAPGFAGARPIVRMEALAALAAAEEGEAAREAAARATEEAEVVRGRYSGRCPALARALRVLRDAGAAS
jgi:predicted ATPase